MVSYGLEALVRFCRQATNCSMLPDIPMKKRCIYGWAGLAQRLSFFISEILQTWRLIKCKIMFGLHPQQLQEHLVFRSHCYLPIFFIFSPFGGSVFPSIICRNRMVQKNMLHCCENCFFSRMKNIPGDRFHCLHSKSLRKYENNPFILNYKLF